MTSRWLFSPKVDVAVFVGSALASVAVVWAAQALGLVTVGEGTPPWAFLVFVVGVDVAHVWSTLFRVYLDGEELKRRPALYATAPLLAFGLGVAAHAVSPDFFWRALAYVAVWHFVRQQVGWVVLYGRRARSPPWVVRLDRLAVYAATLGPVVWWHAHLPRSFWWFHEGDFVAGLPKSVGTAALFLHGVVLLGWLGVMAARRELHLGKVLLVLATWVTWFGGIVLAQSDFTFTVMNVVLHGVPYLALLYRYAKGRAAEGGYGRLRVLLRAGVPAFLGLLLLLAFLEETAWDRLVWHEHPALFGAGGPELSAAALTLVVPLLSLPQVTHYLLDGFVWRTREDASLPARLGWAVLPAAQEVRHD
ncbi:MAG: hypothetical protein AMXMBFR34_21350 [Myxococcaceae bacterium]